MSITLSTKYWILGALLAIVGIFALGWYIGRVKGDRASQALLAVKNDSILILKVKIHGIEQTAYQMTQVVTTQKEAIRKGDLEKAELKALHLKNLAEISRLSLKIDTLLSNVSNNAQIIVVHDTITKEARSALLLPFNFSRVDKWLNLNGMFNKDGKLDIDLNLSFGVDIYSGINKDTKKRTTTIVSDCPYVKTIGIKSFKFDENKPKKWGVGVSAGYSLILESTPRFAPTIGLSLQRNFIRF
jgi:hypothetical protein